MTESSGNVFADLGLPDAEELNTKARLGATIVDIACREGLSQAELAAKLSVSQPKVSALLGYKLEGFSVERLMRFATALRHDVVIEIRPRASSKGSGRISVAHAATASKSAAAPARNAKRA